MWLISLLLLIGVRGSGSRKLWWRAHHSPAKTGRCTKTSGPSARKGPSCPATMPRQRGLARPNNGSGDQNTPRIHHITKSVGSPHQKWLHRLFLDKRIVFNVTDSWTSHVLYNITNQVTISDILQYWWTLGTRTNAFGRKKISWNILSRID